MMWYASSLLASFSSTAYTTPYTAMRGSPPHQDLRAGESANQGVDRRLRGKGRQKHGPRGGRLRIGVRKPGAQRRHRRVEEEGDEDQRERRSSPHRATCPRRRATRSATSRARSLRAGTSRRIRGRADSGIRRRRRRGSRRSQTRSAADTAISSQNRKRDRKSPRT